MGTPPHESASRGGVSESCVFNDHQICRAPGCQCTCHTPQPAPTQAVHASVADPQQLKSCPKCNTKRPAFERFCRACGTKLGSLACPSCNQVCEPSDAFCFACGCPLTKEAVERLPAPAAPAPVVPRVYAPMRPVAQVREIESPDAELAEREVLAALQRGAAGGPKENPTTDVGRTFSLPSGTFRISGDGPTPGRVREK